VTCHYAAAHATAEKPITIVTDCASVVTYFEAKQRGKAVTYDKVLGGIGVDIDTDRIEKVEKVKSHLSYQAAVARDMGQWWQGNSLMDAFAERRPGLSRCRKQMPEPTSEVADLLRPFSGN
jgi:hypothetical protein